MENVTRYVAEVMNAHGLAALDELVADETLKERARLFLAAFPDLQLDTNVFVTEGDLVGVHLTGRATHEGTFQGVPATGRRWAATCSAFFRVEDGRIADFWINWNELAILEQLGGVRRAETASV